eukprot:gnl/TRDRNA2_/TRDRNA2_145241_c0_seq2.p1 gnl/TRDRNA2_/TRDRNA2_145241_c0~~gnl/TRDRNA2_/TRDRNA2_145241_c0_seq2.p1  ORF type:complete len:578 (-),score=112.48 gnl/TRDRNA2_/TRDRNA2_145241_c0_seq2:210-1784(-)
MANAKPSGMKSDETAWTEFGYCLLRAQQEPEEEEVAQPKPAAAAPAFDKEALLRLARQAAENPEPPPVPKPVVPKQLQRPPDPMMPKAPATSSSSNVYDPQAYDDSSAAPTKDDYYAAPKSFSFPLFPEKANEYKASSVGSNTSLRPPMRTSDSRMFNKEQHENSYDEDYNPAQQQAGQAEMPKRLVEDGPLRSPPASAQVPKPPMPQIPQIQPMQQPKTAPPVDQSALQRFAFQARLAQQAAESAPKLPPAKTVPVPVRPVVHQQPHQANAKSGGSTRGAAQGYDHPELWLPPKSERVLQEERSAKLLQEQRAQEERTERMMRELEQGKMHAHNAAAAVAPGRRSRSRDRSRGRPGRSRSISLRRGRSDSRRRRMSRSRSRSPVRSRTRSKSIKRNPPKKYGSKWDMGPADPQAAPQSTVMPRSMPGSMAQPHKVAANEHYIVLRLSDAQIKRMIGKAGSRINEIRARTGSDIRIYGGTVSIVKNASATEQLIRQVLLEQGLPMMADNEVVTRRGYGTTVDRK